MQSKKRAIRPTRGDTDWWTILYKWVLILLVLGCSIYLNVAAAEPSREDLVGANAEAMARQLREQYPSTRIDSVKPAVVPGLFEVVMGKNVAYVEPTGRYFLFGHVWDMQQRRDTTADRLGALDKVDLSKLPASAALTWTRGSGKRVLHVLADPQCGYCRQLEQTIHQLDDATVHVYVLPILGAESRRIAEGVWCSPKREQAWRDWMLNAVQPPASTVGCNTDGLAAIERAARSMGVQATPTLFSGDGRKRAGALPAKDLVAWLDAPPAPLAPAAVSSQTATTTKTAAAQRTPQPSKVKP